MTRKYKPTFTSPDGSLRWNHNDIDPTGLDLTEKQKENYRKMFIQMGLIKEKEDLQN